MSGDLGQLATSGMGDSSSEESIQVDFGPAREAHSLATSSQAPRRGRPSLQELIQKDGQDVLVMLVGAPGGRWSEQFKSNALSGQAALAALTTALQCQKEALAEMEQPGPHVLGFCVLQKWRFVRGPATSRDMYHLMAMEAGSHRKRRTPHFLEHAVVASALLCSEHPVLIPGDPVNVWGANGQAPSVVPADFVEQLLGRDVRLTRGPDAMEKRRAALHEVLATWCHKLGVSRGNIVPWAAWTPLATAIAAGAWTGMCPHCTGGSRMGQRPTHSCHREDSASCS